MTEDEAIARRVDLFRRYQGLLYQAAMNAQQELPTGTKFVVYCIEVNDEHFAPVIVRMLPPETLAESASGKVPLAISWLTYEDVRKHFSTCPPQIADALTSPCGKGKVNAFVVAAGGIRVTEIMADPAGQFQA